MAYIYFDDLKEILPVILSDWIEPGDEGWEWIFQEIEQKCYLGKKKKDKKKKTKIESMVIAEQRNDINELRKRVNELSNKISNLGDKYITMRTRINRMNQDITAAKSMAEIAKNRTEVDYTKPDQIPHSQFYKSLWSNAQQIIKVCGEHGATKEELEQLDLILSKYLSVPTSKKDCLCIECKYLYTPEEQEPCVSCDNTYSRWEAKDDGETNYEKLAGKYCATCKYHYGDCACEIGGTCTNYNRWEAKDNG